MNAGFDEDEAEFGILVFAVALEVLADGDGLVDTRQLPILPPETQRHRERESVCVYVQREWNDESYLLDQHVQVLWDLRCKAYHVENHSVSHRPSRGRIVVEEPL